MSFTRTATSALRSAARTTQQRAISSSAPARQATTQEKASSALTSAAEKAKQIGGPLAQRAQGLFGSWSEPLSYNLKVAGSLLKQVYVAERLAPPTSVDVISSAYRSMWARARDPAYWARFVESGEWKKVGIYAVEAWGIFTIGEMIGRRSLVGYKLDTPAGSHH